MTNPLSEIKSRIRGYSGFAFRMHLPRDFIAYMLFTRVDHIVGFDSKVDYDKHILLIDCDSETLDNVVSECVRIRDMYDLGEMFIVGDSKPNSFRIWCFKILTFRELLRIISEFKYSDLYFIRFTAKRGKAILRVSSKRGRDVQQIVKIVEGKTHPIPTRFSKISYETPDGHVYKFYEPEEIG